MTLLSILAAALAGGLLTVLVAGAVLAVNATLLDRALPRLVSFSTGALLGAALMGMIPHAARVLPVSTVARVVLVGLVLFFVLSDGKRIPIRVSTASLRDDRGKVMGGAETFRDLSVIEELRKEIKGRRQVGDIVSRSPSMRQVLEVLPRIAESESTILLQGETGTGKELAVP